MRARRMARSSTEMVGVGGGLRLRERVVEVLLEDNQVHPTGGQDPPGGQYLTWWAMGARRVRGTCLLVVEAAVCSPGRVISRFLEYFFLQNLLSAKELRLEHVLHGLPLKVGEA